MMTKNHRKIVMIIQARMGATRLPGKPLMNVLGRPLLSYQIERLRRVKRADQIVVATTTSQNDDQIAEVCQAEGIPVYRGSEGDVLDRYYQAAKEFHADVIVRITGDCPLIDPQEVDRVIGYFVDHQPGCVYASNSLERTFPRGLDVEVFSFAGLETAHREAKRQEEKEHVTPYFYRNPDKFVLGSVTHPIDLSHHRWTVDTPEDFDLVSKIIAALYPKNPAFAMQDVLDLLKEFPEWSRINAHIVQKPLSS